MATMYTAEQVHDLFRQIGSDLLSRTLDMQYGPARDAVEVIASHLEYGMDWDRELKQLKENDNERS